MRNVKDYSLLNLTNLYLLQNLSVFQQYLNDY